MKFNVVRIIMIIIDAPLAAGSTVDERIIEVMGPEGREGRRFLSRHRNSETSVSPQHVEVNQTSGQQTAMTSV